MQIGTDDLNEKIIQFRFSSFPLFLPGLVPAYCVFLYGIVTTPEINFIIAMVVASVIFTFIMILFSRPIIFEIYRGYPYGTMIAQGKMRIRRTCLETIYKVEYINYRFLKNIKLYTRTDDYPFVIYIPALSDRRNEWERFFEEIRKRLSVDAEIIIK